MDTMVSANVAGPDSQRESKQLLHNRIQVYLEYRQCLGAFQCLEVKDRGKQPQDVPSDKHCRRQYATSQAELLGEDKEAIDGATEEGSKKH